MTEESSDRSKNSSSAIDRRIEIVVGTNEQCKIFAKVSDLRAVNFYVLLGEPGIGKSTAFRHEAEYEKVAVMSVRDAVDDEPTETSILFLDGLDEFRSEGQRADKVHGLSKVIRKSGAKRWRVSCRAEDWRNEADISAVQRTTGGEAIVVAQLLPLDYWEARNILRAFDEANPDEFLDKAIRLGAQAFTENPMSLKLLREAVKDGDDWPTSRFEVFDRATKSLSHEANPEHKESRDRPSAEQIRQAAGKICLRLLLSGADHIWRSSDQPPDKQKNRRSFLGADDLEIDPRLLNAVLDTPLFRGEGKIFTPAHRTVAEFLAGRELASLITDKDGKALPVSRAAALIASGNGTPPTELRGLFGWLTAHLAHQGEEDFAETLVGCDPVTALAYGDAAVLGTSTRRVLLANIATRDPFFRASNVGVTAFGGLSGEDLSADFKTILEGDDEQSHRKYTVLEVLTTGAPVKSLRPILTRLVLDSTQATWIREHAIEALENGLEPRDGLIKDLFVELEKEGTSVAREALRAKLAAMLWPDHLTVSELRSVFQAFELRPEDNTVGRLRNLQTKLEASPDLSLFDVPTNGWRCERNGRHHIHELNNVLNANLAMGILANLELSPPELLKILRNARYFRFDDPGGAVTTAVGAWLQQNSARATAFFHEILTTQPPDSGGWLAGNEFFLLTRTDPAVTVLPDLLEEAKAEEDLDRKTQLLSAAVELALRRAAPFEHYWAVYDFLETVTPFEGLKQTLVYTVIPSWKAANLGALMALKEAEETEKERIIGILEPRVEQLSLGQDEHDLDWFSSIYFDEPNQGTGVLVGAAETNPIIAAAALKGCVRLAKQLPDDLTPTLLGEFEARSKRRSAEIPALVGLDQLIESDDLPPIETLPISLAIIALKSPYIGEKARKRNRLLNWAAARLLYDPIAGASALSEFWGAILKAGYNSLKGLDVLKERKDSAPLLKPAIGKILQDFRAASGDALMGALLAGLELFEVEEIATFAKDALQDTKVRDVPRQVWTLTAFLIDPEQYANAFQNEFSGPSGHAKLDNYFAGEMRTRLPARNDRDRAIRDGAYVRSLAPFTRPLSDESYRGEAIRVRNAIDGLGENPSSEAQGYLLGFLNANDMADWAPYLRHAAARRARLEVDLTFVHPSPDQINKALRNGAPVNGADLLAIVVDELEWLKADIRLGQNSSWKRFWNLDGSDVTVPLIENEGRNYLLDRLADRLKKYSIHEASPESRRANDTRSDVLILNGAGRNLPIEVKRHFHVEVWRAASTQLQGYAIAPGADGYGILLVFWYGSYKKPPARPNKGEAPTTAAEMENFLKFDLPDHLRDKTGIIVIDVSDPDPEKTATNKAKRLAKVAVSKPAVQKRKK